MPPAVSELLHGSLDPLPERVPLVAGPLSVIYEAGDLRSISVDGIDVINRIYGAIRDHNWATIPGRLSELVVEASRHSFHVTYLSEHVEGAVDFAWRAEIDGTADGEISVVFDGEARASFDRNRIGLCVLHPMISCAGRNATVRLAGGGTRSARFPTGVSIEQPVVGFEQFVGLRWTLAPGLDADLTFEGDLFETEDQRNWIDPTFKTFSTPLRLARPVHIAKGTRVRQKLLLRAVAAGRESIHLSEGPAVVPAQIEPAEAANTPAIGVCMTEERLASADVENLRSLELAHVRVDLAAGRNWESRLAAAAHLGSEIGCSLELALDVGEHDDAWLRRLADVLPEKPGVARVLVFGEGTLVTTPRALDAVAAHLTGRRPDLGPIASGSRQDLFQVHMLKPPAAAITCWGMHPQAHSIDTTSIAETPQAAGDQVRTVKRRTPGARVAISPLRFHPRTADPRLHSMFGAAWTLAILSELAAEGAESVTAFETSGPRGVVITGGQVAPLYHVLADLTEFYGTPAVGYRPADLVTGVLLGGGSHAALLVANLAREARTVSLPGNFVATSLRVLDTSSVVASMQHPAEFRNSGVPTDGARLTLSPFSTVRLDGRRN